MALNSNNRRVLSKCRSLSQLPLGNSSETQCSESGDNDSTSCLDYFLKRNFMLKSLSINLAHYLGVPHSQILRAKWYPGTMRHFFPNMRLCNEKHVRGSRFGGILPVVLAHPQVANLLSPKLAGISATYNAAIFENLHIHKNNLSEWNNGKASIGNRRLRGEWNKVFFFRFIGIEHYFTGSYRV